MPTFRVSLLACALACALASPARAADPAIIPPAGADDALPTRDFDPLQVTATRSQRAVSDVPNTVDVIERQRLDQTLVFDIKDLVRYEPGVSVTSSFGRFGLGGFRIRGLEANRVQIITDGIRVPDAFAIGSYSNANRNFVDLDTVKRVEILRGPASALYGSDALGGVVAFVTKDPSDYLKAGKDAYFGLKFGYAGDWNGLFAGATAAFGGERWSGLAAVSHRQGQAQENMGRDRSLAPVGTAANTRTAPNPQDRNGTSVLTKLVYAPSQTNRLRLTVEGNRDDTDTNVLTSRGYSASTRATTLDLRGADHQSRERVALAQEVDALDWALADSVDWQVYWQDSQTTQDTHELRTTASLGQHRRDRRFDFEQREIGVQVNLLKTIDAGSVVHTLRYGLDLQRTRTEQERDGRVTYADGTSTNVMLPDVFPVRDFPITDTTTSALYVQDEMAFGQRFSLVPAVRVDHYDLDPKPDAIFVEDNPGMAVTGLSKTSVSPKLGAVWKFAGDWSLYGGYARGFRAPPYNDANLGFTNLQFGYTAIPNPDLKPETSNGFELGLRYTGPAVYAALTGYRNDYHDFIESQGFVGYNAQGLMVFQSRNVSRARIYGGEFKGGIDLGALAGWSGWSLRAAAAWSHGQDLTADVPLDTVDPLTGILGLAYDAQAWGVELAGTFARRKDRVSNASYFRPAGFGVADLLAHWNFAPGARVNVGVFNLGDRKYFNPGDVPVGTLASSATLDRYTSSGRSVSASLTVEW